MAPPIRFANHPGAQEAANISYKDEPGNNPVMRGLPLVIGAAMLVRMPQNYTTCVQCLT